MHKEHQYTITNTWTGNKGTGTSGYRSYDRGHTLTALNKASVLCSSDPAFQGDASRYNPEELFLASLSSCHMLWYLHLCSDAGVVVTDYEDEAKGVMDENAEGGGRFISVTLYPKVTVTEDHMLGKALELHEQANQMCFIANSCNFPVHHQPLISV
ncbi:MAG: OsmC family protein [Chitinophagaceae bacterium]|nr:OsmC family protein [Chitinophagaceae bacterium]